MLWPEYGKIWTRKTPNTDTFYAVTRTRTRTHVMTRTNDTVSECVNKNLKKSVFIDFFISKPGVAEEVKIFRGPF